MTAIPIGAEFLPSSWLRTNWNALRDGGAFHVGIKLFVRAPWLSPEVVTYSQINSIDDFDSGSELTTGFCPAETEPYPQFDGTPLAGGQYLKGRIYNNSGIDLFQIGTGSFTPGQCDAGPTGQNPANLTGWLCTPSENANENRHQELVALIVFYLIDGSPDLSNPNPVLFFYRMDTFEDVVIHDGALIGPTGENTFLAQRGHTAGDITGGNLDMVGLIPPWESAQALHLWVEPQRLNYIANPAFRSAEGGVCKHWRAGGKTQTGVSFTEDVTQNDLSVFSDGQLSGYFGGVSHPVNNGAYFVVESNLFPTQGRLYASVSLSAIATKAGQLRVGLLCWDGTYTEQTYVSTGVRDEFPNIRTVPSDLLGGSISPTPVSMMFRVAPGTGEAQLRVIWIPDGGFNDEDGFGLMDVLVDLNESQYEYFDGETTFTQAGDHQWHGGEEDSHFSMWYNNFSNTEARIGGGFLADLGVYQRGLAEEWVANGVDVYSHWHAIAAHSPPGWIGNYYYPLVDVRGTNPILHSVHEVDPILREKYPPPPPRVLVPLGSAVVTINVGQRLLTGTGAATTTTVVEQQEATGEGSATTTTVVEQQEATGTGSAITTTNVEEA